jgi:hypothetical protein
MILMEFVLQQKIRQDLQDQQRCFNPRSRTESDVMTTACRTYVNSTKQKLLVANRIEMQYYATLTLLTLKREHHYADSRKNIR